MAIATAIHIRDTRASQPVAAAENAGVFYIVSDENEKLERSDGSAWRGVGAGTVTARAADPGAPADGDVWVVDDGGSPASVAIKIRKGGVTYTIAEVTI